jgi:alpha-glucosidase
MRSVSIALVWSVAALSLACSGSGGGSAGADSGPADLLLPDGADLRSEVAPDDGLAEAGQDIAQEQVDAVGDQPEVQPEHVEPLDTTGGEVGDGESVEIDPGPVSWSNEHCAGDAPLPDAASWDAIARRLALPCEGGVELRATFLDAGTIQLHYARPDPSVPYRSYAVVEQGWPSTEVAVVGTEAGLMLCSEALSLELSAGCTLRLRDAAGHELVRDPDDGGFVAEADGRVGVDRWVWPSERFYGFGEKTGGLDRRGRILTFWNTDHPKYESDWDPLYQSIPFYVGLHDPVAYGVFTDNAHRTTVDVAASDATRLSLRAAGGEIVQYLFAGPEIRDVVRRYTRLTGRHPQPPLWSLGYHQCRWGYRPDDHVRLIAQTFRDKQIPADGMWLDLDHMDDNKPFTWHPTDFPDPAGLIADLAELGFRQTVIVDPGIPMVAGYEVYESGIAADAFLRGPGGAVFEGEVWGGTSAYPDFTRPGARAWWAAQLPRHLDLGVRGLWLDMNEPANFMDEHDWTVPDELLIDGDGVPSTMAEGHNLYGLGHCRATYEGWRDHLPEERPFVLTRAGYAGVQRYAAAWTGDAPSTMEALDGQLPMLLGMGVSGLPFVGSDVGGWEGLADAELYARWLQLGAWSPFFRSHMVDVPDHAHEPWSFGDEVEIISREAINRRYRLLPYWYSLFREHAVSGAPVLRPPVYEFQGDAATHDLGDQAMLGPWLMVAPVTTSGASSRAVYLPAGRWYEARTGAAFDGPVTLEPRVTLAALPVYVREGAILPRAPLMQHTGAAPWAPMTLDLYPAGAPTQQRLYEDDGLSFAYQGGAYREVALTLERIEGGARLTASPPEGTFAVPVRPLIVRLWRADAGASSVRLNGEALPALGDLDPQAEGAPGWRNDPAWRAVLARIPDAAPFTLEIDYDASTPQPLPAIPVLVEVSVPAGTPRDTPIHLAGTWNDWDHAPMEWEEGEDRATLTVDLPLGAWFEYKITRGGWSTVEKSGGCEEIDNRYEQARPELMIEAGVANWADWCSGV